MPWQGSPDPLWLLFQLLPPSGPAQDTTKFLSGAYGNPRKGKGMGTGEGAGKPPWAEKWALEVLLWAA